MLKGWADPPTANSQNGESFIGTESPIAGRVGPVGARQLGWATLLPDRPLVSTAGLSQPAGRHRKLFVQPAQHQEHGSVETELRRGACITKRGGISGND